MSQRDSIKYQIISQFLNGKLLRVEASELMRVSERTITRWARKVRDKGLLGVKNGNFQRNAPNKLADDLKTRVQNLVKNSYFDFNMTHILETLKTRHNIEISYSTLRRWCWEKKLVKNPKVQRRKPRKLRRRMPSEGLLLQMDGSHHKFNGKDNWCLISAIDDATSEIPYAEFFQGETTFGCLKVLKEIVKRKGIPKAIYTDKAGWTGLGKRDNFSQFVRVCEELGIQVLFANSPEAKGRVERSYRTIQDRLIPEMRINKIKTMKDANRYLDKVFLRKYWNVRNTVNPASSESSFSKVPKACSLDDVFCFEYLRKINKDQTIQWQNKRYLVASSHGTDLRGYSASIRKLLDDTLKIYVMGTEVTFKEVKKEAPQGLYEPYQQTDLQRVYTQFYGYISPLLSEFWRHKVTGKPIDFSKIQRKAS